MLLFYTPGNLLQVCLRNCFISLTNMYFDLQFAPSHICRSAQRYIWGKCSQKQACKTLILIVISYYPELPYKAEYSPFSIKKLRVNLYHIEWSGTNRALEEKMLPYATELYLRHALQGKMWLMTFWLLFKADRHPLTLHLFFNLCLPGCRFSKFQIQTHPPRGSSIVLMRAPSLLPLIGSCAAKFLCDIRRLLAHRGLANVPFRIASWRVGS